MADVLIVFASETGNTEEMAQKIAEGVKRAGNDPVVKDVLQLSASVFDDYKGIMFGSFTDGMGDLPYSVEDVLDNLNENDLKGKVAACFGSGDSSYGLFAAAVDTIQETLEQCGAEIIEDNFKVELSMTKEERDQAIQLGESFARKLLARQEGKNEQ
ncbi:flavodoxin [Sporolactobacillus shoreicorticis]|uniref:Flavodoxin n=1 Tax=Sporolactobacillus shoreicorticis TaxID=1923877 RepID=A0ABW5S895_9BACL|nr:flavodoxin [Sporolactobacillus shoreicorticis]MCO7126869.1 flavodoxin [Sporolactobacillus shoreicorticis]